MWNFGQKYHFFKERHAFFVNNGSMEVVKKLDGLADEILSSPTAWIFRESAFTTLHIVVSHLHRLTICNLKGFVANQVTREQSFQLVDHCKDSPAGFQKQIGF